MRFFMFLVYNNIAAFTLSAFALSVNSSARARAKSNAVPGPLLVISFPAKNIFH
jgi:hypothetical protein